MDTRQLKMAIRLSETLHFGKAADAENIAQSGLSAQLAKLEHEVGFMIFNRSKHQVTLTPAGKRFLEHAAFSLKKLSLVTEECRHLAREFHKKIRIGFLNDGTHEMIYPLFNEFRKDHPDITITFTELLVTQQIQSVLSGIVDVALIRMPASDCKINFDPICEEPRVAAVPLNHEYALAEYLTCAEVRNEPFVVSANGAPSEWLSYWSLRESSTTGPVVYAETHSINESLAAVAYGGAFDTYPASAARVYNQPGLKFIPLMDASTSVLALASLKNNVNPEISVLRNHVRSYSSA